MASSAKNVQNNNNKKVRGQGGWAGFPAIASLQYRAGGPDQANHTNITTLLISSGDAILARKHTSWIFQSTVTV